MAVNKKLLSLAITIVILLGVVVAGFLSPVQSHLRTGDKAFSTGNYKLALKEYLLADKASPDNWNLKLKIAQTYLKQQDYLAAEGVLEKLADKNPARSKSLNPWLAQVQLGLAKQAERKDPGDLKLVIDILRQAHDYQPNDQVINSYLAKELFNFSLSTFQGGDSPELDEAIALDPKPIYKVEKVRDYAQANNLAKMDAAVKTLTATDLADPNVQIVLAGIYIDLAKRGNQAKEATVLDQGLAVLPQNPALLMAKIQRLYDTHAIKEAQAIAKDPTLPGNTRRLLENYWQGLTGNSFVQAVKQYDNLVQAYSMFQIVRDQTATWGVSLLQRNDEMELIGLNLQNGKLKTLGKIPGSAINVVFDGIDHIFYAEESTLPDKVVYYIGPNGKKSEIYKTSKATNIMLLAVSPNHHYLALLVGQDMVILYLTENQGQLQAKVTAQFPGGQFLGWSPDSKQIMLWQAPSQTDDSKTVIRNTQGKIMRNLTSEDGTAYAGWNSQGKIITSNIRKEELGLLDQSSGTVGPVVNSFLYQALLSENGYQLAWAINSGAQMNNPYIFFSGAQDWSPDGTYVALNARLRDNPQEMVWVLKVGTDMPFPVRATGFFVGWSGPNKMLFVDYSKAASSYGDGNLSQTDKYPIQEITLKP